MPFTTLAYLFGFYPDHRNRPGWNSRSFFLKRKFWSLKETAMNRKRPHT
jgi:hypothetical protein